MVAAFLSTVRRFWTPCAQNMVLRLVHMSLGTSYLFYLGGAKVRSSQGGTAMGLLVANQSLCTVVLRAGKG